MKYTIKILILLVTLALSSRNADAQRTRLRTVSGTAQIKVESNMTMDEARREVERLAITNAIENAFGTYVEQQTNLQVNSGRSNFNIIGTTKVKGEWVETQDIKFNEESRTIKTEIGNQQELWITCDIKGKAKEASPKANLEVYTLSYPNKASKATNFSSGDDLFLYFRSPVDGYLSVYLDDNKNIYRIFPYQEMGSEGCEKVEADKEYILFSSNKDHDYFKTSVDELELFTAAQSEINTVHVLFSEKRFSKPLMTEAKKLESGYVMPKSTSRQQSMDWLAEMKATIDDFLDYQIHIDIIGSE